MKLEQISLLPCDILDFYVWKFLSPQLKRLTCKKYYNMYNNNLHQILSMFRYDSLVHDIIRTDSSFIFRRLINDNFIKWTFYKKKIYSNIIFTRYIDLIEHWTVQNSASKCRLLINEEYKNHGLSKKRPKNNKISYRRWSN